MKKLIFRSTKILVTFLIFQVLIGCMTLPGRLIPTITKLPDKAMFVNKPKVFIDINFHTFLKGQHTAPVENITAKDIFVNTVKNVTEKSNLFESYTIDKFQSRNVDYTIQLDMLNYGNFSKAMIAGIISGLTLTVIPVAAKDNYKLTAKLLDTNGNEIKTYVYEDYARTWFQLFLFPFAGTLKKVPNKVMENMIENLYNDILNDNYLKYSYNGSDLPDFLCFK